MLTIQLYIQCLHFLCVLFIFVLSLTFLAVFYMLLWFNHHEIICRSLSLTSLRSYQSLASHLPKIASRWCTPRTRRGLSQPSHMCWASWYLLWVRRWACACCSSVHLWVRVFCISVCFVFLVSFGDRIFSFFFLLAVGFHSYFHNFYCILSVISHWRKGMCGSSWTKVGYAENERSPFNWAQLSK